MKAITQIVGTTHNKDRLLDWIKLISVTSSSQLLIQITGLLSGLIVIRTLPTQEYGLYTLANTMLGTMLVLADGGISTGVLAQGGKNWQNYDALGAVVATGFYLRKRFALISTVIAIPILLYLLRRHACPWPETLLISASLIPVFYAGLVGNLLSIAPSLHQAILPIQKIQATVGVGRLLILAFTIIPVPSAPLAILSASVPQLWGNRRMRDISSRYANRNGVPDPGIKKEILSTVWRILPGSIYYCASGQITIWLVSIFGTTASVAQIGALGRLSAMLSLFSSVFSALIIPRFARIPADRRLLLTRFVQIILALTISFLATIAVVSVFPAQILWILGKSYSGLEKELVLSIAVGCTSLFSGMLFGIATSRSWAINPLISIPITLLTIIFGIVMLNVSSVIGILKLNLLVSFTEMFLYISYCLIKIRQANTN